MSTNCLVTKLKTVVDNDNLNVLGHYKIEITRMSSNDSLELLLSQPTTVEINKGGVITKQEITRFSNNFGSFPEGSYITVYNKYNIYGIQIQGEKADSIEYLQFSPLRIFTFRSTNVSGDLYNSLRKTTNLEIFRVYSTSITGDVRALSGKISNCAQLELRYSKIIGSMDAIIDELPDNASVDIRDSSGITISQLKYDASIARGINIQAQGSQIII